MLRALEEKNVGNEEAIVRGVIGAGALALGLSQKNPIWYVFSAMMFATAFTQRCALNAALGRNTYSGNDTARSRGLQAVH